jgi:hypothetical protein
MSPRSHQFLSYIFSARTRSSEEERRDPVDLQGLGCKLKDGGSVHGRDRVFTALPPTPDWPWNPPTFVSN